MAAITLHKFGILPEDESTHVFTFIFENPQKLLEIKSVESSEVSYGGHRWSVVCMRKEERYMGIYLKWRYSDGQSAAAISCKAKYTLSLIHRFDYADNKYFASNQKFTTSHSLLGKSKYIALNELLDLSGGYLDETGKRLALDLTLSRCSTRFEKSIDTSPAARTRKNVSGFYFDTTTFLLGTHKWYLRCYPTKLNSNGLPAVYLYLASKAKGLSIEVNFRLYLGEDSTELLTYNYGEGAKFDGFGKTLSQTLYNIEKMTVLTIGVEVMSLTIWKDHTISCKASNGYAPQLYKDYGNYRNVSGYGSSFGSLTPVEAFQDHEGNYWKAEVDKAAKKLTITFDKGVHHYQQNKTKLLCWTATLLSRDPDRAADLDMSGEPICGYFSNFIDEKGYRMQFPMELCELDDSRNPFANNNHEILLRINMVSLQTLPLGMRSIPRFDYQTRHLLRARRLLQERSKNLEDMREMAASRASLSFLDTTRHDSIADNDSMLGGGKIQLYKSYDSLDMVTEYVRRSYHVASPRDGRSDENTHYREEVSFVPYVCMPSPREALSTGDMIGGGLDEEAGRGFFSDILRHISLNSRQEESRDEPFVTSRDNYHGTREDVSTESGVTVSDESSMLMEARPSSVDVGKQKEVVTTIIKLLQRLPIRITEVLEFGSLGSGTTTRSRLDADLVLYSPDVPCMGQSSWMPALLHAANNFLQNACSNPDPFYPLPKCSYFSTTPYALQFTCGGVDLDVMFSYDWDADENQNGGYGALYAESCKARTIQERQWCALGSARLQKKFIADQPNEVKEIIKIVCHWRNYTQWKKVSYRPSSYLLSLLVIRAVEETRTSDIKRVLQRFGALVLAPELSLQWSTFYIPDKYPVEFEPPTPLVRDPANPGYNVAQGLAYWGQFRSELILWMKEQDLNCAAS